VSPLSRLALKPTYSYLILHISVSSYDTTHMQLSQRNIKEHVEGFLSGRLLVSFSY